MASKWHPMAGDWGIFGSTKGAEQARENRSRIYRQMQDVRGREQGVQDYFSGLRDLSGAERELFEQGVDVNLEKTRTAKDASEAGYLSSLENFLMDSYNIGAESDAMASKRNLATLTDPAEQFKLMSRRRQIESGEEAQRLKDTSMGLDVADADLGYRQKRLGFDRGELQLGMEETRAMQDLKDQLFQLEEALTQYT
tara:strand:- start:6782 stop:7372 length:591 start_codon:yes stop_codon:yes gene_type:complete